MNRSCAALILFLAAASSGYASSATLDQERVRSLYNDGDFDGVLEMIGRFRSRTPAFSRSDSIFIAKHLAVVYAADPKSVGQGKFWMNELLKLMPAADLVGMYVSDEIDRIFEKVREEFLTRQKSFGIDTSGLVLPGRPAPGMQVGGEVATTQPERAQGSTQGGTAKAGSTLRTRDRRNYWVLGGTAALAAAAGVAVYTLIATSGDSEPPEYVIPKGPAP